MHNSRSKWWGVIEAPFCFWYRIPPNQRRLTIASWITLFRIATIPWLIFSLVHYQWGKALILMSFAAITDVLDGVVARFCNQVTFVGEWLDGLADKLLMITSFIALVLLPLPVVQIPAWFVWFILVKEVALAASALMLYWQHGYFSVPPLTTAKLCMGLQILFVMWILLMHWNVLVPMGPLYLIMGAIVACILCLFVQRTWYQVFLFHRQWKYKDLS